MAIKISRRLMKALARAPLLFTSSGRLRLKAERAERRKDWQSAQNFWLAYAVVAPRNILGLAGAARSYFLQNRMGEAQQTAQALQIRFPGNPASASILAQVAAARHDWNVALQEWDVVLARNLGDYQASMGRAQALLALGRISDAEVQAQTLAAQSRDKPGGAVLLAQAAAAAGNSALALESWRQAAQSFSSDANVLRDFALALLEAGHLAEGRTIADRLMFIDRRFGLRVLGQVYLEEQPKADLTEFWSGARRDFPAVPEFFRREIDAALRAGKTRDAAQAFAEFIAKHPPRVADAAFLVGMWKQAYDGENLAHLMRAYLGKLYGTTQFRPAVLRLSRLILSRNEKLLLPPVRRMQTIVSRAHAAGEAQDILSRVLEVQKSLGLAGACMDSDISPDACRAFITHVHGVLSAGKPFGFVRLGDADANSVPYEADFASFARADAMEREVVWWGAPLTDEARAQMSARVLAAAQSCDVVGIPTVEWFLRDLNLERNDALRSGRSGRGLRAILRATEAGLLRQGNSNKLFASAHLHQHLHRWDLYGELFDLRREVVLVSPHPDLDDAVRERFGLHVAAQIVTPARHASINQMEKRLDTDKTLPQVIDAVLADVAAVAPDRIVVVGAGYLGKLIVAEARAHGAFAFDAGSVVDTWMGIKTRSYLD